MQRGVPVWAGVTGPCHQEVRLLKQGEEGQLEPKGSGWAPPGALA